MKTKLQKHFIVTNPTRRALVGASAFIAMIGFGFQANAAEISNANQSVPRPAIVKTVQANGSTSYSDRQAEGIKGKFSQYEISKQGTSVIVPPAKHVSEKNAEGDKKKDPLQEIPVAAEETPEIKQAKKENCIKLKQNMAALASGRILRFKQNGERFYLSEAQIAEEKNKTVSEMAKYCD